MFYKKIIFLCFVFSVYQSLYASEKVAQVTTGNFALPTSQQPGPLFSFGQNIISKNDAIGLVSCGYNKGLHKDLSAIVINVLYGATDKLAMLCTLPAVAQHYNDDGHSGLGNFSVTLEYQYYFKERYASSLEATILGSFSFPTGTATQEPLTGSESPGLFLGTTLILTTIDWYVYMTTGEQFLLSGDGSRPGNQYLLQGGVGRNIPSPHGWIFMGLIELAGQLVNHDIVNRVRSVDSGGMSLFAGPSFWASSKNTTMQIGMLFPLYEHLYGTQNKTYYTMGLNFGLTF